MKVRLINFAALAAVVLSTQGVAQQNDSLERALADLNSGLAAPAGNHGVTWSGDFRARNHWFNDDTNTNNRDVDTRARLTATFNVTENSTAFVGFNGRETWGDMGTGTTPGRFDDPQFATDPANTYGTGSIQLTRSWVSVDNLAGDGGTAKIGRDYYTAGSGRILGTDEWDNAPATQSGIWYSHPAGGLNISFAMLNGLENGFGSTAPVPTALLDQGDDMVYVFGFDWVFDMVEELGPIHIAPYWIRNENVGSGMDFMTWLGAEVSGELMGFGYNAEYAKMDQGNVSGDAWYLGTSIDLEALASLPGIENGNLSIALSGADDTFQTTGVVKYHDVAGFSDRLGIGGLWTANTDTWNVGLGFSPAESWNGRIAYANVDQGATGWNEIDISVGHEFNGNVQGWFGYAMTDLNNVSVTENTFWAVLDLAFGS